MYDGRQFTQADMDTRYVLRDSHQYQELLRNMTEATRSSKRIERYLCGGIDDDGRYTIGMGVWFKGAAFVFGLAITIFIGLIVHGNVHF